MDFVSIFGVAAHATTRGAGFPAAARPAHAGSAGAATAAPRKRRHAAEMSVDGGLT